MMNSVGRFKLLPSIAIAISFGAISFSVIFLGTEFCRAQQGSAQSVNDGGPQYSVGDVHRSSSRVYVHVFKKTALGHEHAVEGNIQQGRIHLGSKQDAGELFFDMRSFDADTDAARQYLGMEGSTDASTRQQVNDNMRGTDVLDVAKYPTAVFKIDSAQALKEKSRRGLVQYQLSGQFTLHGTTRPLAVVAQADEQNGWTHLRGSFRIEQTDYGMTPFSKAFGVIGVANPLVIHADLWVAGTLASLTRRDASVR